MSVAVRLGLFYAAIFLGGGVAGPFMSTWFKAHGLTGSQIGLILAAPSLARIATAPMIAVWADGFARRKSPLIAIALAVSVLYVAFALARGFWPWALLWFAATTLFLNLSPLADVITLRRARSDGFNYGWSRGIGSAAYILANVSMGVVLKLSHAPDAVVIWMIAAAVLTAVSGLWLLPADAVHEGGERLGRRQRWRGLGGLLKDPVFVLMIVSSGLIQASHAFYYSFSVPVWRAQGIPESVSGLLWGVGVAVEIVFLWFMEPWRRRAGPERLLLLGGLGAVTRWTCLAMSPPLWLLFPIQATHALTFTATFIASLQLIERLAPPASASAAQTLNSALSGGILIGLATVASGALYDALGALSYLAMAAIAAVGLVGVAFIGPLQVWRASKPLP